jgi:protein SCO1
MKLKISLAIATGLVLCGAAVGIMVHRTPAASPTQPSQLTYQVHGKVRSVDAVAGTVRIAHEAIPDYMPPMTMDFPVKNSPIPKELAPGDDVQFELSVTDDDSWISHLLKIVPEKSLAANLSPESVASAAETSSTELQKGETAPDFELIDQNGKKTRLSDFRGKSVVLTFIYTRCPLPNFCPLMSKNFQALQERLEKEFPGQFQLLSVTIDPKFDRPEVLKDYAGRYGARAECWTFATGTQEQIETVAGLFGLVHEPEGGLISHNLRTALIGPDGRLRHVWKSNVWTPFEVDRMIGEILTAPKTYSNARHS